MLVLVLMLVLMHARSRDCAHDRDRVHAHARACAHDRGCAHTHSRVCARACSHARDYDKCMT